MNVCSRDYFYDHTLPYIFCEFVCLCSDGISLNPWSFHWLYHPFLSYMHNIYGYLNNKIQKKIFRWWYNFQNKAFASILTSVSMGWIQLRKSCSLPKFNKVKKTFHKNHTTWYFRMSIWRWITCRYARGTSSEIRWVANGDKVCKETRKLQMI